MLSQIKLQASLHHYIRSNIVGFGATTATFVFSGEAAVVLFYVLLSARLIFWFLYGNSEDVVDVLLALHCYM